MSELSDRLRKRSEGLQDRGIAFHDEPMHVALREAADALDDRDRRIEAALALLEEKHWVVTGGEHEVSLIECYRVARALSGELDQEDD